MKKVDQILGLVAAAAFVSAGCVYSHRTAVVHEPESAVYPEHRIIVTEEPPAPRVEVEGPAPDVGHAWIAGYWTYTDHHWVWVPGHWETRPRTGAVWVPGHWDKNPVERGWTWTPGHWE